MDGITNNEPQKRIKSQMYNSNRDSDYTMCQRHGRRASINKFESELLYESEIMDGSFVFDMEFNIKTELDKCAKIPKSLFSDGHKETVTLGDYDVLESLLDKYLQLKITL